MITFQEKKGLVPSGLLLVMMALCFAVFFWGMHQLTFALRLPPCQRSPIWPQGALLLSTLLVVPARRWWLFLLAALGATVAAFWNDTVVGLRGALITIPCYLTMTAVVAWFLLRQGEVQLFASLRSLLLLIGAAIVAIPFATIVPITLVRLATGANDAWLLAERSYLSIALGTLLATPAWTLTLAYRGNWGWRSNEWRVIEGIFLALALLAVGYLSFNGPAGGTYPALLYAPLPLLVWAAVRFGLAGLSWAMLLTTSLAIWHNLNGSGPFLVNAPADSAAQIQFFVLAVALPLMFLAVVMTERRQAMTALSDACQELLEARVARQRSEERYREVVERQSELVCRYLPDTTLTFVNEAYCRFFNRTRDELLGHKFLELLPTEVRTAALHHVRSLVDNPRVRTYEHEVLLPDGAIAWQQWVDHVVIGPDGQVAELQGIGRDITDRKRVEEALRHNETALRASYARVQELAGKLIAAQEVERSRIARELHDDINQQLAMLAINLSALKRRLPPDVLGLGEELNQLQQQIMSLANDIRNLSHELHPGVLQHAGLVAALRTHCSEFRQQHDIDLSFHVDGPLEGVPQETALCLYRVAQEALANICRHSQATKVSVDLRHAVDRVVLTVTDDGQGFDLAEARQSVGLGLISLDERVRLAGGCLRIDSKRQWGTELCVEVPLGVTPDAVTESTAGR